MSLVSQGRSTLNPNAPLFIPAAVRQVEDYSPEWWQLVTTSTWFHDYWLSQQQQEQQGADGFIGNTADDTDIIVMLPDSIDTPDYDLSAFDADYVQFMNSIGMGAQIGPGTVRHMPSNGLETEAEMLSSLSLSTSTPGSQREMHMARYPERAVRSFSPRVRSQLIQQPR
ncbi:protein EARLY RESPONSIVE TO DEHYDRATION 15-like [Bidens hawaiensis]|uniref:protein EARLY RESPONSIVE TO DEHYDRATION 15-like n=1 Tax=Bidens hawaiensis TaxID=980011 RepID=UPI0040493871